jgi:hypothetical protein
MNLERWVKENWDGLELLKASTHQYRPGVILKPSGSSEIRAAAWSLLDENVTDPFWQVERGEALLVQRTFEEGRKAGGSIKVPGIIAVTVKSEAEVQASFTVEGVEVALLTSAFESDIQEKLRTKFHGTPEWVKYIDDHRVVTESWYMTHLRVTFVSAGNQMGEAAVEANTNISVSGQREWKTNDVLEVKSAGKVPFAVRTFRP